MEYLVLAGGHFKESVSQSMGEFGPFFWKVAAPLGLTLLWLAAVHALWETWRSQGSQGEGRASLPARLLLTLVLVAAILGSGTGFEYLVLGGGYIHARVLAGVLSLASVQ
jgi:hypothetical protein